VNLSPACCQRTTWLTEMLNQMTLGMLTILTKKQKDRQKDKSEQEEYKWKLLYDDTR
jgi:hypothetical protein